MHPFDTTWGNSSPTQRKLVEVSVPAGIGGVLKLAEALGPALDGSGPAIAPMPEGPPAVLQAMRDAVKAEDIRYPLESDDIALVCATSGSTGAARGVLLSRYALQASATAFGKRFGTDARWVVSMPVHRIAGLMVLTRSWFHGSPFEVDPSVGGAQPFDAETFAQTTMRAVQASEIDGRPLMVSLVPTQIARLLETKHLGIETLQQYDVVLSGAAATPQPLLDTLRGHGIKVSVSYGMSETCGGCVFDGRPLDGVSISIGSESDAEPGRIAIGGPVIAAGYRLRPDLDAVGFIGGRVMTHDVGRIDQSGLIHVLGRLDDVVIVGGVNVALSAVEAAIRHHPDIADVAVVDYPDDLWGSLPIAYIVARPNLQEPERVITEMRITIADRIGRAATPRIFRFVDHLPMLDSGKVDRLGLRMQAAKDVSEGRMPHPGTHS